jgi:protein TonB
MFGTLIESRAGRQRRSGGAMMSILLHGAIIAGAVLATTRASNAKPSNPVASEPVHWAETPPTRARPEATTHVATKQIYVPKDAVVIIPPVKVSKTLPPITTGLVVDNASKFFIVGALTTHDSLLAARSSSIADPTAILSGSDVERVAILQNDVRPAYPEALRLAGISGRVVVRFVVDTLGQVEHESVVVRESSHARFENAVRDVLPRMRFTPAKIGNRPVRMTVEMPFEFAIAK